MASDGARRFKALMAALPAAVKKTVDDELVTQALGLVETMKQVAPRKSGALVSSIRAERSAGRDLSVKVKAGGPLTTKAVRDGADVNYDYALGTEFGNEQVPAQPFFYPTARLKRPGIQRGIKRAVKKAVDGAAQRG